MCRLSVCFSVSAVHGAVINVMCVLRGVCWLPCLRGICCCGQCNAHPERGVLPFQDMKKANRIFYLSIPPSIFTAVAGCASKAASSPTGWTRVIVEKPFGKDSESFAQLERELSNFLSEEQMYRIDHYLGKELIENLTVRRSNPIMLIVLCAGAGWHVYVRHHAVC